MLKLWSKLPSLTPIFVACCLLTTASKAIAGETDAIALKTYQNNHEQNKGTPSQRDRQDEKDLFLSQIDNVEQLQDVKPTDWSYEALRGLIERYNCLSGFPDFTFRGQETISREEFAAGLNACLNKVETILSNSDRMSQTDVDTVLRLMQEFQSDLAILQGKTDGVQARVEDLEVIQFSTTTKLQGEAIFGVTDVLAGDEDDSNSILTSRLRLDLKTSFSGEDLLSTRLSRNDFSGFREQTDTFEGNLSFADTTTDDFQVEELHYTFGVNDNLDFIIGAKGLNSEDITPTINVLDGDGGSGSISVFGTRNPIYNSAGDAGIGVVHRPIEEVEISAGYLADPANNSSPGSGLFNGPYSALGQIKISPFDSLSFAATYIHSYNQSDSETGTNRANIQAETEEIFDEAIPTISSSYGLELSWAISDRITIGGWGGLSRVSNLATLNQQVDRGTLDVWNWAATLAFSDLGKEGSLGGIVFGSEPTVTNSTIENLEADSDRSLHIEAFYQYQVSDNISITPGIVWITEPDNNFEDSDDLVIGTIRTTFSF